MKMISSVVVFFAAFILGALTGSLFPTNTVESPYASVQPVNDQPAQKRACRFKK
jgi:hypothetical protein